MIRNKGRHEEGLWSRLVYRVQRLHSDQRQSDGFRKLFNHHISLTSNSTQLSHITASMTTRSSDGRVQSNAGSGHVKSSAGSGHVKSSAGSGHVQSSAGSGHVKRFRRMRRMGGLLLLGSVVYVGYESFMYDYDTERIRIERDEIELSKPELRLYSMLPLNSLSRLWGALNRLELPVCLRSPLIGLYSRSFHCDLEEAERSDLRSYNNLGQFFTRALKPGVRPIDTLHSMTSPSDGIVVSAGPLASPRVEQIKGVTYSLSLFLSTLDSSQEKLRDGNTAESNQEKLKSGSAAESIISQLKREMNLSDKKLQSVPKSTRLYQCVVYLAPGDYHRFHSPADWIIHMRKHFPGLLLSVNPRCVKLIPDLMALNERVVYYGEWTHGFMSMSLVGANNVGSISILHDPELQTNRRMRGGIRLYNDFVHLQEPLSINKGEEFGSFHLGSTIVLIFEAPENFKFVVESGQRIKYGQALGT